MHSKRSLLVQWWHLCGFAMTVEVLIVYVFRWTLWLRSQDVHHGFIDGSKFNALTWSFSSAGGGPFLDILEFARIPVWSLTPNVSTQLFRRSNIAWTRRQVGKNRLDIRYDLILWIWILKIQEDDYGTWKRFGDAWDAWKSLTLKSLLCCHIFAFYRLKCTSCATKIPKHPEISGGWNWQGCKSVVLCSHLGRPDGSAVEKWPSRGRDMGQWTRKKTGSWWWWFQKFGVTLDWNWRFSHQNLGTGGTP